jgi:hypothetical protein
MGTKEYTLRLVWLAKHWTLGEGMKSGRLLEACGKPQIGGNFSDTVV